MRLAQRTIGSCKVKPQRVIADRAYDSDKLRDALGKRGIRLISPHRRGRAKPPRHDEQELLRYRRRWKVERLFAWIFCFRRTVTRYEHHERNFLGFVQIAAIMILTRQLF